MPFSDQTIQFTSGEKLAVLQAVIERLEKLKASIESTQRYVDCLANQTDDLRVGYRKSSEQYLLSLQNDRDNLMSFYRKCVGWATT